ncbi:MAG: aminodeoxychorismate/anthranilate synthase component II [candidate division Zixibacteria bacterium]|nr:aminodeoxychorismate/anthranilate synthase component II [candidate division Zixibacteria bacterium]
MILIIDNYDSFTYNLVQYVGELGLVPTVFRNDEIDIERAEALNPSHLIISPGPGTPNEAGISNLLIGEMSRKIPVLGVCLGHQCLAQVFGGTVSRAERVVHGKTSDIYHNSKDLFVGLPNPFSATRYHSLIVREESLPDSLEVTAHTNEGEIMGLKLRGYPVFGVQFHPESVLTTQGKRILQNFLSLD